MKMVVLNVPILLSIIFPLTDAQSQKPLIRSFNARTATYEHRNSLAKLIDTLVNANRRKTMNKKEKFIKSPGSQISEAPDQQTVDSGNESDYEPLPVIVWKPEWRKNETFLLGNNSSRENELDAVEDTDKTMSDNESMLREPDLPPPEANSDTQGLKQKSTVKPEQEEGAPASPVDNATIGLVIGISVVVFFIIIVNCFTLRIYLKESRDGRSFRDGSSISSNYRSRRYGGGRSARIVEFSDDSIWDANCSTIEFERF